MGRKRKYGGENKRQTNKWNSRVRETEKRNKSKANEKKKDEMREQQCRRLLPGSLSCTHICLQRV